MYHLRLNPGLPRLRARNDDGFDDDVTGLPRLRARNDRRYWIATLHL